MCVLRQKPLEKIVQPCIEIERRMQHTKSVLSRGFERLFDPLIGDHRVALASGTHCRNGASRCSVKRIKFGEEMGRMVFYTFANTGVIHAEKATTPERYLELLTGRHKSRSMTIERCLLLPLGAQLCLPLRPGYLQACTLCHATQRSREICGLSFQNSFLLFALCTMALLYTVTLRISAGDLRPNTKLRS